MREFCEKEMETLRSEIKRAQEFLIKAEGAMAAYQVMLTEIAKRETDKGEEPVFNEP